MASSQGYDLLAAYRCSSCQSPWMAFSSRLNIDFSEVWLDAGGSRAVNRSAGFP
jgi:hypothetical protein